MRIIAHRGNAREFPENSLKAIESAIELGCRYIEFDVQMSSDGVPFLLHDAYLTRLYGKDMEAVSTCSAALESYGIAPLENAVDLIRRFPNVTAFVEIKRDGFERYGRFSVVAEVCKQIDPQQFIVISFDWEATEIARSMGYRIGLVVADLSEETRIRCENLRPEYVFCDQRHIQSEVWPGFEWASYEVSDRATANRLVGFGVSLLETSSVRKMLQ